MLTSKRESLSDNMAKKLINVGTATNSKNGDTVRTAFIKVNDNFDEVYADIAATNATVAQLSTTTGPGNVVKRYEFANSLEWIVNHGMNTRNFVETLTDNQGNRFFAPVKVVDDNSFIVRLTSATSGAVSVYFTAA